MMMKTRRSRSVSFPAKDLSAIYLVRTRVNLGSGRVQASWRRKGRRRFRRRPDFDSRTFAYFSAAAPAAATTPVQVERPVVSVT